MNKFCACQLNMLRRIKMVQSGSNYLSICCSVDPPIITNRNTKHYKMLQNQVNFNCDKTHKNHSYFVVGYVLSNIISVQQVRYLVKNKIYINSFIIHINIFQVKIVGPKKIVQLNFGSKKIVNHKNFSLENFNSK